MRIRNASDRGCNVDLRDSDSVSAKKFAFQQWPDYDEDLFQKIIWHEKSKIRAITAHISGRDIDTNALKIAAKSLELLSLKESCSFRGSGFFLRKTKLIT